MENKDHISEVVEGHQPHTHHHTHHADNTVDESNTPVYIRDMEAAAPVGPDAGYPIRDEKAPIDPVVASAEEISPSNTNSQLSDEQKPTLTAGPDYVFYHIKRIWRQHRPLWMALIHLTILLVTTAWFIGGLATHRGRYGWVVQFIFWLFVTIRMITFHVPVSLVTRPVYKIWDVCATRALALVPERYQIPLSGFTVFAVFLIGAMASPTSATNNRENRILSIFGLFLFLFSVWVFSKNRKAIKWRTVLMGELMQFITALFVLRSTAGYDIFNFISELARELLGFSQDGVAFLVTKEIAALPYFFFTVLPAIVFFVAFVQLLFHWGIMQWAIIKLAKFFYWSLRISGAEAVAASAAPFIGQGENAILIRPFVAHLTDSEIHQIMCSGFATISGSVLVAYAGMVKSPQSLVASCVMSIPASIAISKIRYPETELSVTESRVVIPDDEEHKSANALHAFSNGAWLGLKIAGMIMSNLLCIIALIALIDGVLFWIGKYFGVPQLQLEWLLGYCLYPIAFLLGVPRDELYPVAKLIGIKIIQNEFVAYNSFSTEAEYANLSPRAVIITTYALCGFGNLGSLGNQIGVLGQLAPSKTANFSKLAVSALICGILATLSSASIAEEHREPNHQILQLAMVESTSNLELLACLEKVNVLSKAGDHRGVRCEIVRIVEEHDPRARKDATDVGATEEEIVQKDSEISDEKLSAPTDEPAKKSSASDSAILTQPEFHLRITTPPPTFTLDEDEEPESQVLLQLVLQPSQRCILSRSERGQTFSFVLGNDQEQEEADNGNRRKDMLNVVVPSHSQIDRDSLQAFTSILQSLATLRLYKPPQDTAFSPSRDLSTAFLTRLNLTESDLDTDDWALPSALLSTASTGLAETISAGFGHLATAVNKAGSFIQNHTDAVTEERYARVNPDTLETLEKVSRGGERAVDGSVKGMNKVRSGLLKGFNFVRDEYRDPEEREEGRRADAGEGRGGSAAATPQGLGWEGRMASPPRTMSASPVPSLKGPVLIDLDTGNDDERPPPRPARPSADTPTRILSPPYSLDIPTPSNQSPIERSRSAQSTSSTTSRGSKGFGAEALKSLKKITGAWGDSIDTLHQTLNTNVVDVTRHLKGPEAAQAARHVTDTLYSARTVYDTISIRPDKVLIGGRAGRPKAHDTSLGGEAEGKVERWVGGVDGEVDVRTPSQQLDDPLDHGRGRADERPPPRPARPQYLQRPAVVPQDSFISVNIDTETPPPKPARPSTELAERRRRSMEVSARRSLDIARRSVDVEGGGRPSLASLGITEEEEGPPPKPRRPVGKQGGAGDIAGQEAMLRYWAEMKRKKDVEAANP
ncbi:hypothetical protein SAICODRAFT_10686 [Saitoella complicata NRRL Y-17804]|uniref:uncharacterized protein n=1 Tax=Saitoella complicata (strain BCRC 22490 / CBS 7301 / JCM 7358 / NBRC 10748 / NRRL Y-17804) TaxID=698492 RepID=UPI0008668DEE|nr:uncharacterized protein SAICODRAFT_10686 [Saitoella complicata NRRL Y-17804]ODQ49666.1 hypothetical protein SAICODRAFT_10686 [Saitoella complicata NRRL Y-17804]